MAVTVDPLLEQPPRLLQHPLYNLCPGSCHLLPLAARHSLPLGRCWGLWWLDGGGTTTVCRATCMASDWGKSGLGQLGPDMLGNQIQELNREWTQPWFLEKVNIRVGLFLNFCQLNHIEFFSLSIILLRFSVAECSYTLFFPVLHRFHVWMEYLPHIVHGCPLFLVFDYYEQCHYKHY